MNDIDLKQHVSAAIDREWDRFASEHPNLARVVDRTRLVEQAMRTIADDPDYQRAMEQSHAVSLGVRAIESFVERFVFRLLDRLI